MTEIQTTLSKSFFLRYCPNPCAIYELGEMYAEFNALYFNGELPILEVVTKVDKNGEVRHSYPRIKWEGRYKKLWGTYKPNGRGTGVIKLSRECASDPKQVRSTLLHEMLHAYLDLKNLDTGVKGHGPTFIQNAKRINELAAERGVTYRINFYDEAITEDQPQVYSDLLKTTLYLGTDLDWLFVHYLV
jgi:hypothetical protein